MKRTSMVVVILLALKFTLFGQSEIIKQLKSDHLVEASFYFYPSTLRAFNQGDIPEFNRLIREIKKVSIFYLGDNYTDKKMAELRSNTLKTEGCETLLSIKGRELNLYVMGKEEPSEYIIFMDTQEGHYITELLGTMDLWQIPKLYRKIRNEASSFDQGLLSLVSRVKGHKEAKAVMPVDSVKADTMLSQNPEN